MNGGKNMKKTWKQIKSILRGVREYKKYAIVTPFFMVGEAAMECAIPYVMTLLVDKMRKSTSPIDLWVEIVVLIGMVIVSLTCGIFGGLFAAKASTGLAKNLRGDLYRKIQSFSFANIDKFSASSLVTRMTTDVSNAQMSFQMCIRIVIRCPLLFIFSMLMGFITGGQMAWIFICIIPIVGLGLYFMITTAFPIFMKVFKKYDAMNESVNENISGIRVVKSYVREEYETKKFAATSNALTKDFVRAEKILSYNNPLMNTAIHISNLLILTIGSYLIAFSATKGEHVVVYGSISVEKLSALITYGIQILSSLMILSMVIVMLTMSMESIRRISEVFEEESTIKSPENPVLEVTNGDVVFKNVTFKYFEKAEKPTLENININIKSGQFIGIIGGTGSGKSSLVNLISRLYDTEEGEILVGDVDVRNYDLKVLRDSVAVVLQKNVLFSGTIAQNLRWGNLNATDEELKEACRIAQAEDFIESFPDKYETHIEQGGTNVSGGQRQRLCLARAILKNPKVLILDDSTSAVDTKTDALIRNALKTKIPNTTKIVVAQRISSIENADQIIVMDDGHINAIGTHEELLANNSIYQEVFYTQNKKEEN